MFPVLYYSYQRTSTRLSHAHTVRTVTGIVVLVHLSNTGSNVRCVDVSNPKQATLISISLLCTR